MTTPTITSPTMRMERVVLSITGAFCLWCPGRLARHGGDRRGDRLGGQAELERLERVELDGLAVGAQLEGAHDQAGLLEPVEMQVEQGPADLELAGQGADVLASGAQGRDHLEPLGMVQGG